MKAPALALRDFFVGDDWRAALGVILALGATAALAGVGVAAWWIAPPAVLALLRRSALRRARRAQEL